ncbi:hypothetical protein UA44_10700 [Klebsiella aerogenes]|nr:hypothetical protein UA44_10700 [Klebsiella aerogenes]
MRFGGGDNLSLRADDTAITPIVVAVAIGADAVAAGDVGLVFNSSGDQQRLPVQRRGAGQLATYRARS